jgi:hypothetical protein
MAEKSEEDRGPLAQALRTGALFIVASSVRRFANRGERFVRSAKVERSSA